MSRGFTLPAGDLASAAISGVRAAAAAALELDYAGLAAALEDLAAVLRAIPSQQACAIANAMFCRAAIDSPTAIDKLDQMIMSNDHVGNE